LKRLRTVMALFLAMLVTIGLISSQPAATVQAKSGIDVQLVRDQDSVGPGGLASFHILYHNVENKNVSHTWFKVKVPHGLEVDAVPEGAVWDAKLRQLSWRVKEIKGNGAGVIHFQLKASANLKSGTTLELDCSVDRGGKVVLGNQKVKLRIGSEIHQPLFTGYPDGNFHPSAYITRAEVAAVVARVQDLQNASPNKTYRDVPEYHWAFPYINKVTNAGLMSGYRGYFRPDEPISRAELVAIVLRLRGVKEVPLEAFSDARGHWAKTVIGTAKSLKFIQGKGNDRFHPDGYTERAEAAKLFSIALLRGPLADGETKVVQHFPDVSPRHWAFPWVEEVSKLAHESIRRGNSERLIKYLPYQTDEF